MKHRRALRTIALAVMFDVIGALCFSATEGLPLGRGLYWAITTATTVGYGDITPHTTIGHVVAVLVMLTVIPLFAATFSLLTSGLTADHVHSEGHRTRQRLDHIIEHHPNLPSFDESHPCD